MTNPLRWIVRLFRRQGLSRASREELNYHVDLYVAELVAAGITEAEARRRARLELGDVSFEVSRLADQRPGATAEDWLRDIRHGFRALNTSRTFALVSALLIAIGVGAATTNFTLVNSVLLKPLSLPEPDGIVRVFESSPMREVVRTGVARGNLAEWRRRSRSFTGLATTYVMGRVLTDERGEGAAVENVAQVTCDFFPILRVAPLAGMAFTEEQCRSATFSGAAAPTGADRVVVLGEALWRRRFNADPSVLGTTINLDRRSFRVIGVMPASVATALPGADAFIAWELDSSLPYDQRYTTAFGRLGPGITLAAAQADLSRISVALGEERPETHRDWVTAVVSLPDIALGGLRPLLLTLFAASGILLLIATTNVATLFSARALARGHEVALRLALGASRGRIVRQGLIEATIVAATGGLIGTVGAMLAIRFLKSTWADLPRAAELAVDTRVALFALLVTILSGAMAGVVPALRQARRNPNDSMHHGARLTGGRRSGRLRDGLVVAQLALTVVLLTGAGLLIRSVGGLEASDSGFDARDVIVAPVFLDSEGYRNGDASRAYYSVLFDRLRAIPGVVAVGGATTLPTSNLGPDFARPVWPIERAGDEGAIREAAVRIVTPGYLEAMRIRVVAGRPFNGGDGPDAPRVVSISESLAERVWPNQKPIGKQLVVDYASAGTYPYEVVGVVGDVRFGGPRTTPLEEVYFPHAQRSYLILNVAVRSRSGHSLAPEAVLSVLREVDPQLPPHGVHRLSTLLNTTFERERRAMQLLMAFAVAAIVLSALGIYGMVAYRVHSQRREIGVRLALGSSRARVIRWLATELGRVLTLGGLAGLAAAALGTNFITALLYNVGPHDALTSIAVVVLLVLLGILAAAIPAYLATRVDPITTLRGS